MRIHKNKTVKKFVLLSFSLLLTFPLWSFSNKRSAKDDYGINVPMKKPIKIVITKNTTKEELQKIEEKMNAEGFFFKYGQLAYNDKNEIVSISIKYKDGNNNSGNYSVSSEHPINNIVIVSEGSQISVSSQGSGNQAFINQGNSLSTDAEQRQRDTRAIMEERRAQMEREMDERRQEMNSRREQMQKRMDSLRANDDVRISQHFQGDMNTISKSTTPAQLENLQKVYKSKNILLSFDHIKRNVDSEITSITITINNQKGSISTSSFGNGMTPIKDISIAADANNAVMKNVE